MSKRFAVVLAAATAFAAFGANAQQASGNIQGVAVTGDTVSIYAPDIGVKREITVEKDGKWMMRRVPLGTYVVNIKHTDGTAEKTKQVTVQAGTTARVQ
jgi:hypothetical protein